MKFASVAELADAQGLGPCVLRDVEVRLLSLALAFAETGWYYFLFSRTAATCIETIIR